MPSIAAGSAGFLAAWQGIRDSVVHVYGTRVAPDGSVLDPSGIELKPSIKWFARGGPPAVASDGRDYLAVWPEYSDHWYVCGSRVSRDGELTDRTLILISSALGDKAHVDIRYCDTTYLVVWEDGRNAPTWSEIYGARITKSGRLLDSTGILLASGWCHDPALAADGAGFFVVWDELRGSPLSYDICGVKLSEDGYVMDSTRTVASGASGPQIEPSVAFGGTDFLVTWMDARDGNWRVYCASVGRTGTPRDKLGTLVSGPRLTGQNPAVASGDSAFLVVWEDRVSTSSSLLGARITHEGILIDTSSILVVSNGAPRSQDATVAFDGTGYVVAWTANQDSVSDIYCRKITPAGRLLDTICVDCRPDNQDMPKVACNAAGRFLCAYSGWTELAGYYHETGVMRTWGKLITLRPVGPHKEGAFPPAQRGKLTAAPSPFRSRVTFSLTFPDATGDRAGLLISNVNGRLVRRLPLSSLEVIWDGTDDRGMALPAGIYFARLCDGQSGLVTKILKLSS
jgi:hypothetical protein